MRIDGQTVDVTERMTGFLGAAPGYVEDAGEDVLALGFGDTREDAEYVGLTLCDAYELRNALDRFIGSGRRR